MDQSGSSSRRAKSAVIVLVTVAVALVAVLLLNKRNALERAVLAVEDSKSLTVILHDPKENNTLPGTERLVSQEWRARFIEVLREMPFDDKLAACGFHPDVSVKTDSGTLQFCLHCSEFRLQPTSRMAEGRIVAFDSILALFADVYPGDRRFKAEFWKPGNKDNPWRKNINRKSPGSH